MTMKQVSILDVDWRHQAATTVAEDPHDPCSVFVCERGLPVTATTFVKYGEKSVDFGDPSAPALFLSQSHKAFQRASQIHPFLLDLTPSDQLARSTIIFDYLEEILASIVFAYTAIEAFANEMIPEDFVYEHEEETDSGLYVVRQHSRDWIEQHIGLSEKLIRVLPEVTGKPSPKGSVVWEGFVHLRRLRNRIVHLKKKDRVRSKGDDLYPDSIWKDLLDPQQRNYPEIAKDMILHFKEKESTHWLRYCPF